METVNSLIKACEWAPSHFFIFSENVFDPLVYYSHLLPIVLSLVIGGLLFFGNRKRLTNKILFAVVIIFSVWCLFDLVLWATPNPPDVIFFWSLVNMLEPFVYVGALVFLYSFIEQRLPPLKIQGIIAFMVLPMIALAPTAFNIVGFDLTNCEREVVQGALIYYGFLIEIIFALWIIIYGIYKSHRADFNQRKQIILATIGLALFLFSFSFGNIIGSVSENWVLGQVGLFGLPIFVAFLGILIGKYHSFKTRIFSAQLLVIIIWVLILATLFVQDIALIHIVSIITLLATIVIGVLLIKSVRREVSQKEKLSELNDRLTALDAKKNEFLSFATHQLRSPLTSIKWGLDSVKENNSPETIKHLSRTTDDLISTVNDLLDISKIEQGGLVMKMEEFDLHDSVARIAEEFRQTAEKKGLKLSFRSDSKPCFVVGDESKLRQVFVNLIDNAVKYTKSGTITVDFKRIGGAAQIRVSDTGPGISHEELKDLFDKFLRGAAGKDSQSGSGLGLYLAKKIIDAHKGHIQANSAGLGHGSEFSVTIPIKD